MGSYDPQEFQILTMRASIAILIGAIILCAQAQEDLPTFRCPEDNGFFPDPEQCDLYYECIDNIPEAKLCPDGLLFEVLKNLKILKTIYNTLNHFHLNIGWKSEPRKMRLSFQWYYLSHIGGSKILFGSY